jgi:hypothetical protein
MPAASPRACRPWPAAVLFLALASTAAAQTYTGPSKCVGCHDHDRQALKWQKEEPAQLKGKAHFNTLKQLDAPKSAGFAKAIGLADPYDLKGSCVKCHSTVFRGDANAGVSCESCHGPSSGYIDVHQQKGAYLKSVAAGLRDLKEKPSAIARTCVECHVVSDKRLAAAGHPAGEGFEAGASLAKVVHWNTRYDFAQVTAAGRSAAAGRAPGPASKAAPVVAVVPPQAAAPPPAAPAGAPAAPPPRAAAPAATRQAAAPVAAPAPWDWDQPIRPLPDDYKPDPIAPAAPAPAPVPAQPEPAPAVPAAPANPPARSRPPIPAVPPSIAEDSPIPEPPRAALRVVEAPAADTGPRPKAAQVAELRGRAATLLEQLLRAGARTPAAPAPTRPVEFKGPDGELLRLQDEVLALALEALRRPTP